jgi:hypothetical protein
VEVVRSGSFGQALKVFSGPVGEADDDVVDLALRGWHGHHHQPVGQVFPAVVVGVKQNGDAVHSASSQPPCRAASVDSVTRACLPPVVADTSAGSALHRARQPGGPRKSRLSGRRARPLRRHVSGGGSEGVVFGPGVKKLMAGGFERGIDVTGASGDAQGVGDIVQALTYLCVVLLVVARLQGFVPLEQVKRGLWGGPST